MKDNKIIIALHKQCEVPNSSLYLPLLVGADVGNDFDCQKDNEGDNISHKNLTFCELTGLYWAWKNLSSDVIGIVHYRRYFAGKDKFIVNNKIKNILSNNEVNIKLERYQMILPKKRRYFIESLYSHYAHTMYVEPLDITGEIIAKLCPEYSKEFDRLKKRTSAHMFNMLVCEKDLLNAYCEWLFNILFKLEQRIDLSKYDAFHSRCFGRISELLLDVYINTNKISYTEQKLVNIERVNWCRKIISFLKAKYAKQKYKASF